MSFTTVSFLFLLLPCTLFLYIGVEKISSIKIKNYILLVSSIIFYAWCGIQYLCLLLALVIINYFAAKRIEGVLNKRKWLISSICLDIAVLAFFKYFNFFVSNIEYLVHLFGNIEFAIPEPQIPLPLGISFFVFQMIAFLVDVYRGDIKVASLSDVMLFFLFFPQLVQGPIIRYKDIQNEVKNRRINIENLNYGAERFIIGFAKKILIADQLLVITNNIFNAAYIGIPRGYAWLGAVCYAYVIYYDFSGYSDMAIGLCRMFGFRIHENFDHPYIAHSVADFWRRWHISLSTWFRDYIYIPLGGSRKGTIVTYRNLLVVFAVTGIWHGANWTFIVWGLWHGLFRLLEQMGWKNILNKLPRILRHTYTMFVVLIGWVFFRADSIGQAMIYIKSMFVQGDSSYANIEILKYINMHTIVILVVSLICSLPIREKILSYINNSKLRVIYNFFLGCVFMIAIASMVGASVSPSIYTKF